MYLSLTFVQFTNNYYLSYFNHIAQEVQGSAHIHNHKTELFKAKFALPTFLSFLQKKMSALALAPWILAKP